MEVEQKLTGEWKEHEGRTVLVLPSLAVAWSVAGYRMPGTMSRGCCAHTWGQGGCPLLVYAMMENGPAAASTRVHNPINTCLKTEGQRPEQYVSW